LLPIVTKEAIVRNHGDDGSEEEVNFAHSNTVVVHIEGVRLFLRTSATNGPLVHPPDDICEYGELRWNGEIDRGKLKK
jgi:hypothetical protein